MSIYLLSVYIILYYTILYILIWYPIYIYWLIDWLYVVFCWSFLILKDSESPFVRAFLEAVETFKPRTVSVGLLCHEMTMEITKGLVWRFPRIERIQGVTNVDLYWFVRCVEIDIISLDLIKDCIYHPFTMLCWS